MITRNEYILPVLSLLSDTTARATVFLALAAAVAVVLARRGRASAALRHLVWTLSLACALFLPLLSRTLPGWHLAVLPATPSVAQGPHLRGTEQQSDLSAPAATMASSVDSVRAVHPGTSDTLYRSGSYAQAGSNDIARVPAAYMYLSLIWTAGILFMLLRLAQGLLCLRILESRHSVPVTDPHLLQTVAESAATMGVMGPVALRQALASMPAVKVPLTYGALRPVIVLPPDVTAWPPERLRAALLHELAHVRRWDWTIQMLAQVVRAFYWFHPLTWLAVARVRAESEDACDDLVLAAGMPAKEYARHLVDVALGARDRSHNQHALTVGIRTGAVAMIQTPKVEKRVRTILAPGKNRAEVTSSLRFVALVSTATVLLAGAVIRLTASPAEAQSQAEPSPPIDKTAEAYVPSTQGSERTFIQGEINIREPQFPKEGRSPAGVVRLEDVVFKPAGDYRFYGSTFRVRLTLSGKKLSVIQTETGDLLWSGPVSDAHFVLETVAAVQTLKHASGKTLWTDEAKLPAPDLRLDRSADGTARLSDRNGATLWSGNLDTSSVGSAIRGRNGTLQMSGSGVLITGTEGNFSVYSAPEGPASLDPGPNSRLLWSGKLPVQPTILIRDGQHYGFTSPNRSANGSDRTTEVSFEAEVGQVTVADLQGRTIGTQAVDIIKNKHQTRMGDSLSPPPFSSQPILTQQAELADTTRGTVLLTYRDSTGHIIRRSKLYRDEKGSGTISN